jgi:hypothetical protein
MSLDKSIKHGKSKRKPHRGAKAIDAQCRNHGSCPYCKNNRLYKNKKKEKVIEDEEIE